MKTLAWMLILCLGLSAHAQDQSKEIEAASKDRLFQKAAVLYSKGKYQSTVEELDEIQKALEASPDTNKAQLGFVSYWQGLSYNRMQDFFKAIEKFDRAMGLSYVPQDLNYEYGQALFAADKLSEARIQFNESLKKKFKRGVSLYYIAYISKEMGDKKKAVTFYKAIEKLPPEDSEEVRQAAEMQIGDIFLEQVEKHPDAFRAVETYVIPQYEKAMAVGPDSKLAPQIKDKIVALQRKYDLVLFQMRNGRPTQIPPYFMRIALEVGEDTNVTFSPTETTVSKSKQSSLYTKNDFFGRYTFYYRNMISVAPELRFNYTRYHNRVEEIYKNDNYLIAPAIRTAHEHHLWNKPASTLFDFDYGDSKRDVLARQQLVFSSKSKTLMLGERFNFFDFGESILRLRYRIFDSYVNANDSKMTSLVYEQIRNLKMNTLVFYFSYDRLRSSDSSYDTNAFTWRTDMIMSRYRDWFTPSIGILLGTTDPINNRAARGREYLINPNVRLSKTIGKNWRGNLKGDYQQNQSKDETRFAYKKFTYSFELEYLF